MISRLGRTAALACMVLGATACVNNEISFFIENNQVPISAGIGVACMTSADPMALHRNEGVLDLTVRSSYTLFPLYRNEMISDAQYNIGQPQRRALYVDGAAIELHAENTTGSTAIGPLINVHDSTGTMVSPAYTISTNGFVDAATASGPGYGTGTMDIIPASVGAAMFQTYCLDNPDFTPGTAMCPASRWPSFEKRVVVVIRPFGHTLGGEMISGSQFDYPVTVCCHCLVEFMAGVNDPTNPSPNCSGNNSGTIIPPCTLGQDDPVDCRLCSGNFTLCQPFGFQPGLMPGQTATCPTS